MDGVSFLFAFERSHNWSVLAFFVYLVILSLLSNHINVSKLYFNLHRLQLFFIW